MKKGDRVITPTGPGTVARVYSEGKVVLAHVIHDDIEERGKDGYMIYWTRELKEVEDGRENT